MGIIFDENSAEFKYIMASRTMTNSYKAWAYMYVYILPFKCCRNSFQENRMNFDSIESFTLEDRPNWHTPPLPQVWHENPKNVIEFWSFVKFWCDQVLNSKLFYLTKGGSGTDGGFGLSVLENTQSHVICEQMVGVLEPLTQIDRGLFVDGFKYKSLLMVDGRNVHILYGPMSLLNNDNESAFMFKDREHRTRKVMNISLPMTTMRENYPEPYVTSVDTVNLEWKSKDGRKVWTNSRNHGFSAMVNLIPSTMIDSSSIMVRRRSLETWAVWSDLME